MERPATVAALFYIGVFLAPGFFLHRTAAPETFAVLDDHHYSFVYGSALRMVLGHNPADLRINYGLFSTLSAAFLAKFFAIETFAGWIKLTQFFQIFFLFCAAISAWVLERNRRLVLLVIIVTALYASTWNFLIPTPNNTGFRFLGFALLPLALAILKKCDGLTGALIASFASAIFILWDTETGLACSSALLFYIFVSEIANRRTVLDAFWLTSLTVAASVFLVASIFMSLLGAAAKPSLLLAQLIGVAGGGYNGHLFDKYVILAVGLALYASSLVLYCCLRARDGLADRDLIARAALATASTVWFGYYAHNAFSFGLSINLFLMLLTLGPLVQMRRTAWLSAILLGVTCNFVVLRPTEFTIKKTNIEGVMLPNNVAAYLQERNNQIKWIQSYDMFYFVSAPFTTALMTKRANDSPIFDPFVETWTKDEFERLVRSLNNRDLSLILVESDGSPLLDAPRREFLHRIRDAITPKFRLATTKSGLEFWSRQ
jgi:hypothetical protein